MEPKNTEQLRFLYEAILTLQSRADCEAFFSDLCTATELREMARRLHAARMLSAGESYLAVAEATGLSTATISRVSRALKEGSGYAAALRKSEDSL